MAKSNKVVPKKVRGRPATGRDPVTAIRLSKELRETVDKWADTQGDQPGRSEAIRRLIVLGLTVKTRTPHKKEDSPKSEDQKQRARETAVSAIDKITNASVSPDDQASRKRRLVKGPEEFQNVRRDRPNRK
jgi:hypothetical protein